MATLKNKKNKILTQRNKKFEKQRKKRGWDDSDTWGLDGIIAKFTLPRLKRFRKIHCTNPIGLTMKEWNKIIDDIIYALEICEIELDGILDDRDCNWDRVDRGLKYFGERFRDLWW